MADRGITVLKGEARREASALGHYLGNFKQEGDKYFATCKLCKATVGVWITFKGDLVGLIKRGQILKTSCKTLRDA